MSRRQKDPLRSLTDGEHTVLAHLSRSQTAPAAQVAHARALLAVAAGQTYTDAAHAAGRRSGDAVAHRVTRFNRDGLAAIPPGHGGGQEKQYGAAQAARILHEAGRAPDRDADGTATWSLTTLQRAVRRAVDGLPRVSRYTIWCVLHDAGFSWQKDRSWCETGSVLRTRKAGVVLVTDSDATAKKT